MTFPNDKKTFLAKLDKSKKGSIDERGVPLLNTVNALENYYTTSSCSGRVYLWSGSGKKNETQWLKMSHDPIALDFFELDNPKGVVWLRFESSIFHICCKDLESANSLLLKARTYYKKSSILTASNKIIVEIRGGDVIEMPFYIDGERVFSGDFVWLFSLINSKMNLMWNKMEKLRVGLSKK